MLHYVSNFMLKSIVFVIKYPTVVNVAPNDTYNINSIPNYNLRRKILTLLIK